MFDCMTQHSIEDELPKLPHRSDNSNELPGHFKMHIVQWITYKIVYSNITVETTTNNFHRENFKAAELLLLHTIYGLQVGDFSSKVFLVSDYCESNSDLEVHMS